MEKSFISDIYCETKIITPEDDNHYFFGYYDLRASQGKRHLCHRVKFMDRLPEAEDVAELGYLEKGEFVPFATTTAWNFQQGALLQYHPYLQDTVYYNTYENGVFSTVTHNYATGEKKYTDRPVACISPNGKWGMAVNFGRIYDFRPGYGYAAAKDPYADVNIPEEDGIFLTDMEKGTSRMLVNYVTLAEAAGFTPEQKVLVNHITFNPGSNKYMTLVRNFKPKDGNGTWSTSLLLGDLEGNVKPVLTTTYVSHYIWVNDRELVAHCSVEPGRKSMYCIDMESCTWKEYDMPYFHDGGHPDIHCNISPDGKYIIGDGYVREGYREIQYYNIATGESRMILKAKSFKPTPNDIRCDLHNRFVFDGEYVSFDTIHNGKRQVAIVSAAPLNKL